MLTWRFLRPDADIDTEARGARKACETVPATIKKPTKTMPATEPLTGGAKVKQARRRGRPSKSHQSVAQTVEWWKPDWQGRPLLLNGLIMVFSPSRYPQQKEWNSFDCFLWYDPP